MILEFSTPTPSCPLPITHPARAVIPSTETDILRTWLEHSTAGLGDDYDDVERSGWLELSGEFRP
jgi:hypothetical protein